MKLAIFDTNWEYSLNTPYDQPLGGTQSAICYFLEEMASRGHQTYLFNKMSTNETVKIIRGVTHVNVAFWYNYIKLNNMVFDIIIVSCIPSELIQLKNQLNEPTTMFGLWTGHDIDQAASKLFNDKKMVDFVDLFIFVSDWQRLRYVDKYGIPYIKTLILRNGIGKPFEKYLYMPTNKISNSMTYCSIPWRGLGFLGPIFKKVKEHQPNASLKIFSGMNIYQQPENTELFEEFKKIESVECNVGISQSKLADELYKIDYLSYPNTFQETSCITAIQAMSCGCMVITSNLGALKETMGGLNEYIDINIHNFAPDKYSNDFIAAQLKLMGLTDQEKELLREQNRVHIRDNYLYSIICSKFEQDIKPILSDYSSYISNLKNILNNFIEHYIKNDFASVIKLFFGFKYFINLNDYYTLNLNLGVCFHKIGNLEKSIEHFKIAKTVKNDFNVNKNIALVYLMTNSIDEFIKYAREAINLEFDILLATLLAEKYYALNLFHESIGLYKAIIDIEPDNENCLNNLANCYLNCISDSTDFDKISGEIYEKSLNYAIIKNEHRKKELILSNMIFNNLYNWTLTDTEIFKKSTVWYDFFPKETKLINITGKLNRNQIITNTGKIRIGYISTDFISHPVGYMFDSILKNHNTNNFEIFCYDNSNQEKASNDVTSKKLRSYNNASWRVIENKLDEEIIQIIVNDNIDILVDMMGHTRNTRMNVLQYKPARIIVSYFAYPSTNGLKEIDYRFSDKYATPKSTQKYFTEKLYYLPNGFQCYSSPVELTGVKNYTRDKYKIHLGCFNNPLKISKPTIEIWVQILKKLPTAKLFLRYCYYNSSYLKQRMLKRFTSLGIEEDRIDIGCLDLVESLKLYDIIDIGLDPFPYNGGTISSEMLWQNTPFITLAGSSYVSRVGVSLLSNLGLEKYIANTTKEYIQKVIDLANNPTELRELHQTIRLRMLNSDLANSVSFTNNIESAYTNMVKIYNENKII
jgi:tetratricopeptide (TPR) repeat protein